MKFKSKWQWMSNKHGGQGWFSDKAKKRLEGTAEFKDGYWRPLYRRELEAFRFTVKRLAYEQS